MYFLVVGTDRKKALGNRLTFGLLGAWVAACVMAFAVDAHGQADPSKGVTVGKKGAGSRKAARAALLEPEQGSAAETQLAAADDEEPAPDPFDLDAAQEQQGAAQEAEPMEAPAEQPAAPRGRVVQPKAVAAEPAVEEAPAAEPPAGEAPAGEAPAGETPVEQPPAEEPQEAAPPRSGQAPPPPAPPAIPTPTVRPRPPLSAQPARPGAGPAQPSTPAEPNGFRPGEGKAATEPFDFNYEGVDLINIIKSVGALTGKNFFIDPSLGQQKVTVISYAPMPPELAYRALESILAAAGFKMVPTLDDNLIRIRPISEDYEKAPVRTGFLPPEGYDEFSTYIVPVQYADVTELATILRQLGSKSARVDAYGPTNTLIICDVADGIRNMLNLLEQIDVADTATSMEIFMLEYTRAETLSQQIQEVLLGVEGEGARSPAGGQVAARPTPTRPIRPTVPGQTTSTVIGSREETLRIVSDERLNALVVVATDSMMERARDLINKLDTPTPYEANNMHIYELLHANAELVEAALNAVTGTAAPREGAQQAAAQTGEVQPFERKVTISKYEQTNALLIVASPQDYKVIQELIAQLDVPQRQVHVEAVIMEVAINDGFTLSVESAALDESDAFALNNVVTLANILTQGALAAAGSQTTVGYIDGTTEISVPTTDADGNVTDVTTQTIPNIPLLLTAVQSVTDLDVLSQPSLMTVDNEEAKITVGQEIPIVSTRNTVSNTGFAMGSRVERVDVGVKMTVKPQINEGDVVSLALEVEVSQPIASSIGIDPNEVGATFQKSLVKNNIIVKDGSTGVIGGLISTGTDRTISQTPILGDIPGLGWLFRNKSSARRKRNLVVLVTPHIVKERADIERLTNEKLYEFNDANVDVLFEKGFIRKTITRHQLRNKFRPSATRSQEITGDRGGFGRGDLKR